MLPSEAVATLQLHTPSVGGEGDMLLVPSAQGQLLFIFRILSFHFTYKGLECILF